MSSCQGKGSRPRTRTPECDNPLKLLRIPRPSALPWSRLLPWLLVLAAVAANLSLLGLRRTADVVWGDEGAYLAMIESLVRDGDLVFDDADLERAERETVAGRRVVKLQLAGGQPTYSKPVIYPLLAALPYALLGSAGLVGLNAVALAAACWLAWLCVRERSSGRPVALTLATFAGTGVLLAYVAWTMSDSLQASLALAGMALCLSRPGRRGGAGIPEAVLGAALLGLAAVMRYPNLILAVAVVAALLAMRRVGRAGLVAAAVTVSVAGGLGANLWLTGAADPYTAVRATFSPATGYPVGRGTEVSIRRFVDFSQTHHTGPLPDLEPALTAYSSFYLLAGRHTGLLLYLPAALALAWAARRGLDGAGAALLGGAALMAAFYLIWMPTNYQGGSTFVGNRYFLPAYGALLLAPRRPLSVRAVALVWGVAALAFVSAAISVATTRDLSRSSQSHTHAGIFRLFPDESSAMFVDGRRDRYWSGQFLRFVDPYPEVGRLSFSLAARARPAEITLADSMLAGRLRFLVRADTPGATLVYRDWRGRRSFPLEPPGPVAGTLVEIEPAPSLRRHPYPGWRRLELERAIHTFSLELEAPDRAATAELRYLGPYQLTRRYFFGEIVRPRLPAEITAGRLGRLRLRLHNRGSYPWQSRDVVPVHLEVRFERPAGDDVAAAPIETRLLPLTSRVPAREPALVDLRFAWPFRPGRYDMTIDLVAGRARRFEEWTGEPLYRGPIEVASVAGDP